MDEAVREELSAAVRAYRARIEEAEREQNQKQREREEVKAKLASLLRTIVRPKLEEIARELVVDGMRPEVKEFDSYSCGADRGPTVFLRFTTRTRSELIVILARVEHKDLAAFRQQADPAELFRRFASWTEPEFSAVELERAIVTEITSMLTAAPSAEAAAITAPAEPSASVPPPLGPLRRPAAVARR